MRRVGCRAHLVAHRLEPLVVEGRRGEPVGARSSSARPTPADPVRSLAPARAYCTVCLPQRRAAVCSTCRTSSGSLSSSAGRPGTGKATRSPKRSQTSTRKRAGRARIDRKARAMSSGAGAGDADVGGSHRLQARRRCSRAVLARFGGPARPTPHRSSAPGRSRRRGPPPARRASRPSPTNVDAVTAEDRVRVIADDAPAR